MDEERQKLHDLVTDDADGFLYHYTSLEAFIGIINTKTLWASHIKYLNDTSEQEIMRQLVLRRMNERAPLAAASEVDRFARWKGQLEERTRALYVICFSEDRGDRLSQWRAYGGSGGACLAFRKSDLNEYCRKSVTETTNHVLLSKIHYVPPEGDKFTDETIDHMFGVDDEKHSETLFQVGSVAGAATLKHFSFQEEKEWRMLMSGRTIKHRVRGSLLVPYVELDLRPTFTDLLAAVIVGPTNHKKQTAEAVKGMLEENGFWGVEVRCSEIPYRGF